jgi:hypothetical protein
VDSSKKLEALSNIATTTVAVLLSIVLVKQFLLPQRASRGEKVGEKRYQERVKKLVLPFSAPRIFNKLHC